LIFSFLPAINGEGENVALESLGATASASSSINGGVSSYPIDGVPRGQIWPNSCHTGKGPDEWWEVALAKPMQIAQVTVSNRIDKDWEMLEGAHLILEDERRTQLMWFMLGGGHSRAVPQMFEVDKALARSLHKNQCAPSMGASRIKTTKW
jgi:hypothetical protein